MMLCLVLWSMALSVCNSANVLWALNAGGNSYRSVDGVLYNADIADMPGTASDHGVHHVPLLARVHPQDRILYQTERYHYDSFGYDIPIQGDGSYVLNLKFSEVYFKSSHQKIFDVRLNNQPVIVGLDIFNLVGFGAAHDEYVSFKILGSSLLIGDYQLAFSGNLYLEFAKTDYDNPKINAIVLYKGNIDEIPKLPPIQKEEEIVQEELIEEEVEESDVIDNREPPKQAQPKKVSRPKKANPYDEQSAQYWPIIISIGVLLPTVVILYTRQKAG